MTLHDRKDQGLTHYPQCPETVSICTGLCSSPRIWVGCSQTIMGPSYKHDKALVCQAGEWGLPTSVEVEPERPTW